MYLPQEGQALWGHLSLPQFGHLTKEPSVSLSVNFLVADLALLCFFLGKGVISADFNPSMSKLAIVTF